MDELFFFEVFIDVDLLGLFIWVVGVLGFFGHVCCCELVGRQGWKERGEMTVKKGWRRSGWVNEGGGKVEGDGSQWLMDEGTKRKKREVYVLLCNGGKKAK